MSQNNYSTDLLIIGGGTGGSAAAWQGATLGVRVIVIEPTPWLGGMITAAGVSAFDGNKGAMASGFFRRLRDAIEANYGGPQNTFTGWISETCFEPKLAAGFLNRWVAESGADIWFGAEFEDVLTEGKKVTGAVVRHQGESRTIRAAITVDATEYGDVIAKAGVPFRLGRDAKSDTGEEHAPEQHDLEVQDLTLCATLKKYPGKAPALPKPSDYDPGEFDCSTSILCTTPDEKRLNHGLHDWGSFIGYATLPNDKYLLNWPFHSNDSPDTIGVFGTAEERAQALKLAKERTLRYVYYMQNDLGHPEWGLATDEYPTDDHLPMMPYMRESRRIDPVRLMVESDVVPKAGCERAPLQRDSIAIGDYFLDHHHSKAHLPPDIRLVEDYPDNAPFQIPFASTVPKEWDGLMAAEKNIGVSHIVNGCSRLQPVVMLTGQAIGAAAALAIKGGIEPRALDVAELQKTLIAADVALFPSKDLLATHPAFRAVQALGVRGFFPDDEPMTLAPDRPLADGEAARYLARWKEVSGEDKTALAGPLAGKTRGELFRAVAGE
ncbi:MAG: FAD-dependent oxidoreductase [Sumerlaeia bacterium]